MLKADGFDKAFLGVASRFGMDEVFAYDYDKVLKILQERDGMCPDEARIFSLQYYRSMGRRQNTAFCKTVRQYKGCSR